VGSDDKPPLKTLLTSHVPLRTTDRTFSGRPAPKFVHFHGPEASHAAHEDHVKKIRHNTDGGAALELYGVVFSDAGGARVAVPGTDLVVVRELAAIVAPTPYVAAEASEEHARSMGDQIAEYGRRGAVLPAPLGVIFRSRQAVTRWLELHYVALSDALSFVDARVAGRVHVWRPGDPSEREVGSDLAAAAAEVLRDLRRSAVATVPLRTEELTGIVLSAAFLVDQELWKEFASRVTEQGSRVNDLRLELTGPWPPYDFVHMEFGS
jgi:hypothetical protein